MTYQPNPNAVSELERIMREMTYLTEHPRIQQRTWVASAKEWLPLLQIVHSELTRQTQTTEPSNTPMSVEANAVNILVEVHEGKGMTLANIALESIQQVEVYRGGEPGYRYVRGAHSSFVLKDRRKYLTNANEAQRIVDVLGQYFEADTTLMLARVDGGNGQTYVVISLKEVQQVEVYRGGEPGYAYVRGAHSGFTLKGGQQYTTDANEAQRMAVALHRYNSQARKVNK